MSILDKLLKQRDNPRETARSRLREGPLPLPRSVPTRPADARPSTAERVTLPPEEDLTWWDRRRERIARERALRQRDLEERRAQPVRAAATSGARAGRSPTAVVSGDVVEQLYNQTIRWSALIVLAVSFVDTMVSLNNAWPTPFWKIWSMSPYAIVGGIALQSAFTFFEWGNRKRRFSLAYGVPLLLDIAFTYYGFFLLFGKGLTQIFTTLVTDVLRTTSYAAQAATAGSVVTHIGIILISFWFAYYPEQTLVD